MNTTLENLLSVICSPGLEEFLAIAFLVWSLNISFSRVQEYVLSQPCNSLFCLGAKSDKTVVNVLSLLYFIVTSLCALIAFTYCTPDLKYLLLSVALFLLFDDAETFVTSSQFLLKFRVAADIDTQSSTIIQFLSVAKHLGITQEKFVNLLSKLFGFGVGATSGCRNVENVFLPLVLQQSLYMLFIVGFTCLSVAIHFKHIVPKRTPAMRRKRIFPQYSINQSAARRRSHSCSANLSYPERQYVSVSNVCSRRSSHDSLVSGRIRVTLAVILCLLYLYNQFLTWFSENGASTSIYLNSTDGSSVFYSDRSIFVRYFRWQWFHWFNRTSLNLSLFVITAFLLHRRVTLRAEKQAELIDLDVETQTGNMNDNVIENGGSYLNGTSNPQFNGQISLQESLHKTCSKGDFHLFKHHGSVSDITVTDDEVLSRLAKGDLKTRELESILRNPNRAVALRRIDLCRLLSNPHALERLPFNGYDYRFVHGQCCEEVIGFVPIPVGKVGPLLVDGASHYLPLATTEGCLVASTNRGCRAIFLSGGANSVVFRDQMTRAPVVWFPSVFEVVQCIGWIESTSGFEKLKSVFDRTSGHINLISVFPNPSGHYLHIRFAARTGDAMGMNMVSKATNAALHELQAHFPTMQVISLSGNMCTDKKAATINTILGRGKSVIVESQLPATVLAQVLHTTAARLVRLSHAKNWSGSALAGCPGMMGSNAHAANIVAGLFAATGQDLAQVVDACACLTQFEMGENDSLIATVTMPCLEVGTIGGGTRLPAQRACLDLLGLNVDRPTEHLARLIAAAVLAGELSLMAALDTDDLVSAHLRLNRSALPASAPLEESQKSTKISSNACLHSTLTLGSVVKSDASGRLDPPHPTM